VWPGPVVVLAVSFTGRERSFPDRFSKKVFGGGYLGALRAESGIFEDQGAAIIEGDFLGTPCRELVETVWVGIGGFFALLENCF